MIVKKTAVNVQHHFRVFMAKLEQVTEFSINVLRSVIIKPSFQAHFLSGTFIQCPTYLDCSCCQKDGKTEKKV